MNFTGFHSAFLVSEAILVVKPLDFPARSPGMRLAHKIHK
jgi:hypothetical protein